MVKNRIPPSTKYSHVIEVQIANGNLLLEHICRVLLTLSTHQNLACICCLKLLIHGLTGHSHLAYNIVPASPFWLLSAKTFLLRKSCQSASVGLLMDIQKNVFLLSFITSRQEMLQQSQIPSFIC